MDPALLQAVLAPLTQLPEGSLRLEVTRTDGIDGAVLAVHLPQAALDAAPELDLMLENLHGRSFP